MYAYSIPLGTLPVLVVLSDVTKEQVMIEKQGVCEGETEAPKEKTASCGTGCGCGTDTVSKMSEKAAETDELGNSQPPKAGKST
jgi:hypothetical protein